MVSSVLIPLNILDEELPVRVVAHLGSGEQLDPILLVVLISHSANLVKKE